MPPSFPAPRPGIENITAYVPGDSDAFGGVEPIKLSSNETPLGASAKAVAAYRDVGDTLARYPNASSAPLRAAIAAKYGLNADHIVCGAGSDEILNLLASAYLRPGDEAIYTQYGFMVYRIVILANSATPVIAPERQYTTDVDAILARASDRTRIVFLANPNNPTGTYMAIEEVRRLRAGLPDHTLLVLDAAYAEYVRRNDYEAGIELVATTPNTVMTRTFSKIHGLAGLRLGWAYCPVAVADVLNRIRGPFNVSSAAIAAGTAAIADDAHLQASIAHNDEWLPWITEALVNIGIEVTPSVANFVLLHFPTDAGRDAAAADAHLRARAIIVRRMDGYGLPGALRLTIGTSHENHAVVEALTDFMRDTSDSGLPA